MIRVILDFTCIQHQLDKYVWFAVDKLAFSSIKCLKESVCKKFNLANIQFYVKDALLRDDDTILLLRDEDVVKVLHKASETFAPSNFFTALPERSSRKRRINCSFDFSNEETQGHVTNDILSGQENQVCPKKVSKKKKKHRKKGSDPEIHMPFDKQKSFNGELNHINLLPKYSTNAQVEYIVATPLLNPKINITSTDEVSDKKNDSFIEIITNDNNSQNLIEQADIGYNEIILNNTSQDLSEQEKVDTDSLKGSKCRKRKRRRHRKRKDVLNLSNSAAKDEFFENSQNTKFINKTEIISEFIPINSSGNNGKENKHIKFPESSDDSDSTVENTEASIVEFNSPLLIKNNSESMPVSSTSQKLNLFYDLEELRKEISEKYNSDYLKVSSAKSCPQDLASSPSVDRNESKEKKKENSKSSKYTPLHIPPIVGTHIAYKMLELDAMYCPVVSDYKEGIVKKIDPVGNIEIELFHEEIRKSRCGKFEVNFDDCDPESEIIKMVSVSWSSMIKPQTINA